MVWPSASARATAAMPMVPPAPGRFSTMKGWPSCSDSRCATVRAMMSVALPAVNGTTTVTRLVGHDCGKRLAVSDARGDRKNPHPGTSHNPSLRRISC